jgi:HD superfamily phosphohydrolase
VGHGPFSHLSERPPHTTTSHEERSVERVTNQLQPILEDHGIDVDTVTRLITGDHPFSSIIAGAVDVDRMDYLMRDAYYTGVAPGVIEADTIIHHLRLRDEKVVFHEKAVLGIESMLTARYFMVPKVYNHHAASIASRLMEKAITRLDIERDTLMELDDPGLIHRLRTADNQTAQELMQRIDNRDLYKRAYTVPGRTWRETLVLDVDQDVLEQEVAAEAGLKPEQVLAVTPPAEPEIPQNIPVLTRDDEIVDITAVSNIYDRLPQAELLHHPFIVAAPREHRGNVGTAAETVIDRYREKV